MCFNTIRENKILSKMSEFTVLCLCFRLFLARGADVELENNKGETPEKV